MSSAAGIGRLASWPARVRDYARPRPTTAGDLPASSPGSGAIAGAIQGYITGGPFTAACGAIGGYVGVMAGQKSGSFLAALGAGTATGAALSVATSASLAAMVGGPIGASLVAGSALVGGFAGAIGTLSGSRRAVTRDSVYGGMIAGALGSVLLRNPALMLAGAAGAGIGGRAVKPAGRLVLSTLAGAAAGAIAGLPAGPGAALVGAAAGALIGPIGTTVGPVLRQVQRNLTEDLTLAINRRLDPWLEKHPLSNRGKILAGAAAGALSLGPLGLLLGGKGLLVAASVGATAGAVSTWRFLKKREAQVRAWKEAQEAARAGQARPAPAPEPARQKRMTLQEAARLAGVRNPPPPNFPQPE
jgi:hypothetical protein